MWTTARAAQGQRRRCYIVLHGADKALTIVSSRQCGADAAAPVSCARLPLTAAPRRRRRP
ncbi:hypothetical protein XH87_08860 [Bradyrhizobium sp. CCBAU 53415]|nr:hypothetical protein [Bradyrhizobium sp. CCBAU 53380]MDA9464717.1 hypothetical protein [Bradyrhizobium sp. CCBAU 53415]